MTNEAHKFELIGVGNPLLDALIHVDDSLVAGIPGDKGGMVLVDEQEMSTLLRLLPGQPTLAPGGSAGNTAGATARLGLTTTFLGKLGNDEAASAYAESFRAGGGDTSRFKRGTIPNGRCLSLVTPDSERTMRTYLGAAMTLSPEEISTADFANCKHAHIEGYLLFNRALMIKVLTSAKSAGCSISLDLASFEVVNATKDILPELLKEYVDVVFANEEEAQALMDGETRDAKLISGLLSFCPRAALKIGRARLHNRGSTQHTASARPKGHCPGRHHRSRRPLGSWIPLRMVARICA
ncbi:MAG: adenosine kinase [Verrucomicrobia bacterium]|nr:adenosine kinase [Verrucomicrobiota bacterium]